MKKRTQFIASLVLLTILFTFVFPFANLPAYAQDEPILQAEAAILVDAVSGKILYEKNSEALLGVASMSKMMTEYLVLEAIKSGSITWNQNVTIDESVHKLSEVPGLSNIVLKQGEPYTVKELYEAMAIFSGNAAAAALAQLIGGTEKDFVILMNEKAAELNLKDYKFVNASGLNNSDLPYQYPAGEQNDENLMSARAAARLAYYLLSDYPEVLDTAKKPSLLFKDGKTYPNSNWMLPGLIAEYHGVDGLKTGYTGFAGNCFTGTAERNGTRYLSVVMHAETRLSRFSETEKLLNYAFHNFSAEEIIEKGHPVATMSVPNGKETSVTVETDAALNVIIKQGEKESLKTKLVLDPDMLDEDGNLTAPLNKGDKVGYLTLDFDSSDPGFLTENGEQSIRVDVVVSETVEKANPLVLCIRFIGEFISNIWNHIF